MSISNISIGKRISNLRKAAGLTQAELSEKIGISEKYLSRIECGIQVPSVAIIADICETLCVSSDKLLSLNQSTASHNGIQNEIMENNEIQKEPIIQKTNKTKLYL